jgi:hypothetical protein
VLTWNVGGKVPGPNFEVARWLLPEAEVLESLIDLSHNTIPEEVDLYVVGLQEIVDLNVVGSLRGKKDFDRMILWQETIRKGLLRRMP